MNPLIHIPAGFYVSCSLLGILGWLSAMLTSMEALRQKAVSANLQFNVKAFFYNEKINMFRAWVVIAIFVMLIKTFAIKNPDDFWMIKPAFVFIGFSWSTVLLQLVGVTNRWLNAAIKYKSAQSDEINGTQDAPTPAAKPK